MSGVDDYEKILSEFKNEYSELKLIGWRGRLSEITFNFL